MRGLSRSRSRSSSRSTSRSVSTATTDKDFFTCTSAPSKSSFSSLFSHRGMVRTKNSTLFIPKKAKLYYRYLSIDIRPGWKQFKIFKPDQGVIFDMADSDIGLISKKKNWQLTYIRDGFSIIEHPYVLEPCANDLDDEDDDEKDKITIKWDEPTHAERVTDYIYVLRAATRELVGVEFRFNFPITSYGLEQELECDEGMYNLMFNQYFKPHTCGVFRVLEGVLFTVGQNKYEFARHLFDFNNKNFPDRTFYRHARESESPSECESDY
jgi:hypothetical protein